MIETHKLIVPVISKLPGRWSIDGRAIGQPAHAPSSSGYAGPVSQPPSSEPAVVVVVATSQDLTGLRERPEIAALLDLPEAQRARAGVIIDASGLKLISSRGLAELIMLRRELASGDGRIRIAAACEQVRKVVTVCHLDEFFELDESVSDAREQLAVS